MTSETPTIQLKECLSLLKDGNHTPPPRTEYGFPMLSAKDITVRNEIDFSNPSFIDTKDFHEFHKNWKIESGDILMTIVGSIGRLAIVNDEHSPFTLQRSVAILRTNERMDNNFLFFWLQSHEGRWQLESRIVGAVQACLFLRDIGKLEVPKLNLNTQKEICKVPILINEKISLGRKVSECLQEYISALFRSWFIDFDPVKAKAEGKLPYGMDEETAALFPDKFEDSELGPIPAGWKYGKLGNCLSIIESGKRPKGGAEEISDGVPSIGAESINGIGNFSMSNLKLISYDFFSVMKKGIVENGDVMLYKDGAHVGRVAMFDRNYPFDKCAINEHVFRLRTNGHLTQHFLYCMMSNQQLRWHLECRAIKAAQPGLNQKDLESIPIVIPSIEVVNKFTEIVNPLFNIIFEGAKANQQSAEVRNALLPRLMSGELKVPMEA